MTINAGARITGGQNGGIGTLTLSGAVTSATFVGATGSGNLATYLVDIIGSLSDRLILSGALDLSNAFDQISFNGAANGTSTYVLASYTGVVGTFDTVTNLPSGYTLSYGATELDLVPVPEPSTWIAGALAGGVVGWSVARKKRKAEILKSLTFRRSSCREKRPRARREKLAFSRLVRQTA